MHRDDWCECDIVEQEIRDSEARKSTEKRIADWLEKVFYNDEYEGEFDDMLDWALRKIRTGAYRLKGAEVIT